MRGAFLSFGLHLNDARLEQPVELNLYGARASRSYCTLIQAVLTEVVPPCPRAGALT